MILLTVLLLSGLRFIHTGEISYNISKIDRAGIYFEHIGKVNHFDSEWNLITYLNIANIQNKIDLIDNTFKETRDICNHNKFSQFSLCHTSLLILEQIIPQLRNQGHVLKELTGQHVNYHRVKRSYIDGVGSLFKLLFGTLDSEDAQKYDEAIEELSKNKHDVLSLLKTQSNIIKTTISNFNNTITDFNTNERVFNFNLRKLSNYTKDISIKLFDINLKQDLDEHMSLLTLITTEVNNEISTIIDAILFARSNSVHPIIISPEQYISELRKTMSYLPSQTKYPLELSDNNASELLSLTSLVSYFMNNKLIFVIKTPLITQMDYDLYNMIPVPIRNNDNTFVFILPNFKYFMISSNKLHYTNIESPNVCKKLSDNVRYICKLETPLYSVHASKICETELMFSSNRIPRECDTRIGYIPNEQWYKLFLKNQWMFVIPKNVVATLNCKNKEPFDIDLYDTGILSLSDNCKLYTANIVLTTQIKGLESSYNSYLPPINIFTDDCCKKIKTKNITHVEFIPLQIHEKLDLRDLNLASRKIDQLDDLIDKMENETTFHKVINNFYFIYIVMSILKALGFYILYRIGKYLLQRKFFCTPQSRMLGIEDSRSCCNKITNCITLKVNSKNLPKDVELEEISSDNSENVTVTTPLRRSARIAQLKIS